MSFSSIKFTIGSKQSRLFPCASGVGFLVQLLQNSSLNKLFLPVFILSFTMFLSPDASELVENYFLWLTPYLNWIIFSNSTSHTIATDRDIALFAKFQPLLKITAYLSACTLAAFRKCVPFIMGGTVTSLLYSKNLGWYTYKKCT